MTTTNNTQQTFLSLVAADLLHTYGNDMRHVTVVFPSKRAGLFLSQELFRQNNGQPVWAPTYITMSDLFRSFTKTMLADPIDSICTLYNIYRSQVGTDDFETLDRFWGWGEIIMADFDDIDKHLADPQKVFRNVYELMEVEDQSYITPEQWELLQKFFRNIGSSNSSELQQRFIRLWKKMSAIYTELHKELKQEGRLWEGALYREVCDIIRQQPERLSRFKALCFVGFNVLNDVEQQLMLSLKDRSRFYWDYDIYYTHDKSQEAGIFMSQNIKRFGSALPEEMFDNLSHLTEVNFISCSTDNAAARYTTTWLEEDLDKERTRNAAVLCNENLLLPVLHSLPDDHDLKYNVTMGFGLTDTPVYSFINALMALQIDGYDMVHGNFRRAFLNAVEKHPFSQFLEPEEVTEYQQADQLQILEWVMKMLRKVGLHFGSLERPHILDCLYTEAIYQAHLQLKKFQQRLTNPASPMVLENATLRRLIRSAMSRVSIPFHGEPAEGIQIMGVLETRCLDFTNLLMLSVEEGNLPKQEEQDSMIPPFIREAYHLTTPRHKICIFAYYFYRLIQRAKRITFVFNENCTGIQKHEISRFLRQLQAECPQIHINKMQLQATPEVTPIPTITATKERMEDFSKLSPTAINTFFSCPLRFYYKYVANIRPNEEETDEVDASLMGTIFHDSAQILYAFLEKKHQSKNVESNYLDNLTPSHLRKFVELSFELNYFQPVEKESEEDKRNRIEMLLDADQLPKRQYVGQAIIVRDVVIQYLQQLVERDKEYCPFTMLGCEIDCKCSVTVDVDGREITLTTGGRIDRLDAKDGVLRIVDYKTGFHATLPSSIDKVFTEGNKHPGYIFQTLLYAYALSKDPECAQYKEIHTALFYTRESHKPNYDPVIRLHSKPKEECEKGEEKQADFYQLYTPFEEGLKAVLRRIFSTQTSFYQTDDLEVCNYCDCRLICNKPKTKK